MGAGNRTAILVIAERVSRYVMIVPFGSAKDAVSVARALIRAFKHLPAHLRKTLTYDNGREMAQHAAFSLATKVALEFGPKSRWKRSGRSTGYAARKSASARKGGAFDGFVKVGTADAKSEKPAGAI